MKAQDITTLIKALQSSKTLEEQREAVKEISKIVNKKTESEKAQEKTEQEKKSKERISAHSKRDLLTLSALTKAIGKTDIQYFRLTMEAGDKSIVRSVDKPHISKYARIKAGLTEEEWDKLAKEEQAAKIKAVSKDFKKLITKFSQVISDLNKRTGFSGSKFSVDPDQKGITYRSEFRKEKA